MIRDKLKCYFKSHIMQAFLEF